MSAALAHMCGLLAGHERVDDERVDDDVERVADDERVAARARGLAGGGGGGPVGAYARAGAAKRTSKLADFILQKGESMGVLTVAGRAAYSE